MRLDARRDHADARDGEHFFAVRQDAPTGSHLWTFKRQMCQQMALSCFISALLRIGGRAPQKIVFAKNTGRAHAGLPMRTGRAPRSWAEPVPFRLTRNLHAFFTTLPVKGDFSPRWPPRRRATRGHEPRGELAAVLQGPAHGVALAPHEAGCRRMTNVRQGWPPRSGACPGPTWTRCQAPSSCVAPTPPRTRRAAARAQFSSVQKGAEHMVDAAVNPKNLARMEPTCPAWLPV